MATKENPVQLHDEVDKVGLVKDGFERDNVFVSEFSHDINLALQKLELLGGLILLDNLDGEDVAGGLARSLLHDRETTTAKFLADVILNLNLNQIFEKKYKIK